MRYINMDDLTTVIQNRLLVESIEKDEEVLNGIEDLVISEVSAYLSDRYDVGILVKLRDGIMSLHPGIPLITDEEGNVESPILFGHTRNNGWFL